MATSKSKKPANAGAQTNGTQDGAPDGGEQVTAAPVETAASEEPATAATAGGVHAEVQAAVKAAADAGDHPAHAALSGIETSLVELRMKLASFEHVISEDVQAVIAKIKAFL